jgi:hypothetical protein
MCISRVLPATSIQWRRHSIGPNRFAAGLGSVIAMTTLSTLRCLCLCLCCTVLLYTIYPFHVHNEEKKRTKEEEEAEAAEALTVVV